MIRVQQLKKKFPVKDGVVTALSNLDLKVDREEFFVLLGPSGSGKSTLLRCVAGIETPEDGEIYLDDRLIYSSARHVFVRPEDRGLGMVFQSYAVWPHMTVYQNVSLPLTHGTKSLPRASVRDRVMHALSLVQMEEFADRPVPLLSGGQQQRVALARALAVEPVVLLMDEPLSNLDARLREEVRHQIREITRAVGVTVLYVTHDQTEALALGDRIAVMDHGQILQIGPPDSLFQQPAQPMVADFFGQLNWLQGTARDGGRVETPIGMMQTADVDFSGPVRVGIRPANVQVSLTPSRTLNEFSGHVTEEIFLGEQIQLTVRLTPEFALYVKAPKRRQDRWKNKDIYCRFDAEDILIFPEN